MNTIPNPTHGVQPTAADLMRRLNGPRFFAFTINPEGGSPHATVSDDQNLPAWITSHAGKLNCYLSAAMPKKEAGIKPKFAKTDMAVANALWVDRDPEGGERFESSRTEILAAMRAHRLPPSCIVDSGNGFQAYWFLKASHFFDGDESIAAFEGRNEQLCIEFGCDDRCYSTDHIMRMPDTPNVMTQKKLDKGYPTGDRMARIVEWYPDRTYDLEQFDVAPPKTSASGSEPAAVTLDRSQVAGQDVTWLQNVPADFPPKGRIILEHDGTIKALCDDLEDAGLLTKDYRSWNDVTFALAAVLKSYGQLSLEQMAAVLMAPLPCNRHVTTLKGDKFRAVERALNRSHDATPAKTSDGKWPDGADDYGKPNKGALNTLVAIKRLGVDCKFDTFRQKPFIHGHAIEQESGEVSDDAVTMLRFALRQRFGMYPDKDTTREAITATCRSNMHNPVTDWLDSLVWDKRPRLDTMLHTYFGADDTPYHAAIGRKTMCAAVRRARSPGCKFDHVLTIDGPQDIGKSMSVEDMAGEQDLYADTGILADNSKEAMEQLGGKWFIEIGELAGFNNSTRERIKAFVTRKAERARSAYAHFARDQARSCVFVATKNPGGFLNDPTGERRWWIAKVVKYDRERFLHDREQLFAEAVAREPTEKLWLDTPELKAAQAAVAAKSKAPNELVDLLSDLRAEKFNLGTKTLPVWEERISSTAVRHRIGMTNIDVLRVRGAGALIADAMMHLGWTKADSTMVCSEGKPSERGYRRLWVDDSPALQPTQGDLEHLARAKEHDEVPF